MKKLLSVFCAVLVVACLLPISHVFSADTDFVVEDGVLVDYVGSSTSITIPASVRSIENGVFAENTTIKSIKLHDKVYSIGDKAFYGCSELSVVSGGTAVSYVGALAFVGTKFLSESTDEFVSIGSVLLCYNGTKKDVVLPNKISSVSPYSFVRNSNIISFSAGNNLASIGEGAFYECSSLSVVDVKNSVSFIGADAFKKTKWLESQTDFVTLGDGILVAYKGSGKTVSIPNNVKQIASNAFYKNTNISSLTVPSSVFAIGARSFMDCTNLATVKFADGLIMIGEEAFANCSKLESITTPTTLEMISKGAFVNCTGLTTAYLKGIDLSVGHGAFAYCTSLDVALLSSGVSKVDDYAFSNTDSLKYITVPPSVSSISEKTFDGNDTITLICDKGSYADTTLSENLIVSYLKGDSGLDGKLDVLDATKIQRCKASIITMSNYEMAFSDVDYDTSISILDATYVQRILAKLI